MKILNLFPLTVMQDTIQMENNERDKLIEEIKMKIDEEDINKSNYAWTVYWGHEFLFQNFTLQISRIKYQRLLRII